MEHYNLEDCVPTGDIVGRHVLVDVDNLRAVMLRFDAGFKLAQHHHPTASELYVVIDGTAQMRAGGNEAAIGPGDVIHLRPAEPHAFVVGDRPLTLLAIVAPNLPEHVLADGRVVMPAEALAEPS